MLSDFLSNRILEKAHAQTESKYIVMYSNLYSDLSEEPLVLNPNIVECSRYLEAQ